MHTTEHTDLDGDALTITHQDGKAWITITHGDQELTTGPFPARVLNAEPPRRTSALAELKQRIRELHTADPGTGDCIYCSRGRVYAVPAPCATVRLLEDGAA